MYSTAWSRSPILFGTKPSHGLMLESCPSCDVGLQTHHPRGSQWWKLSFQFQTSNGIKNAYNYINRSCLHVQPDLATHRVNRCQILTCAKSETVWVGNDMFWWKCNSQKKWTDHSMSTNTNNKKQAIETNNVPKYTCCRYEIKWFWNVFVHISTCLFTPIWMFCHLQLQKALTLVSKDRCFQSYCGQWKLEPTG